MKPRMLHAPSTAHDVRQMRPCVHCKGIGNRHSMIEVEDGHIHGGCYRDRHGLPALLALPWDDVKFLTMEDIGPEIMEKMVMRKSK